MGTRLSPLDTAFLHVEDKDNRMHLAGILTFTGPTPTFEEFRAEIDRKLPALPHFQHRLARSTFGLARPCWVPDDSFDLDYHLHHLALPSPGGHDQLTELIDDMTAAPLDMKRPLWELSLVDCISIDGTAGFGIAVKVHHCMVDGLSIIDIFATLCAPAESVGKAAAPIHRTDPAAPPVRTQSPIRAAAETVLRLRRATALVGSAPSTRLNAGPSGPTRRTEFVQVPLADIQAARRAYDTTINNIVLAVVSGALHRYLTRHGECLDAVHAFVPVNKRPEHARGTHGNQIGMTYPALPVGEADPAARIDKVKAAVTASHAANQADDTAALIRLGRFAPQPVAAALNRAMQFRADMFNLTVTNVPGPPVPVYFLGRELQLILGATPLTRKHALTIAVLSYNGGLTFSVTTDPRRLPDGNDLVADIQAELDTLHALIGTGAAHA